MIFVYFIRNADSEKMNGKYFVGDTINRTRGSVTADDRASSSDHRRKCRYSAPSGDQRGTNRSVG